MPIATQEMIRGNNRRLVLEYIINHPPVSRADLSKQLKLTKATISNIVLELINQNLVLEIGSAQTSLGRKPILLEFNQKSGFALAIDIRPGQVITLLSDLRGETCRVKEYPFPQEKSLLPLLRDIIRENKEQSASSLYGIVGIAIGIYGVVQHNKVIFTPYYPLPESGLCQILSQEFQIPVIIENEANLSVLGESAFHNDFKNMIQINVHDGIGMGILVDGKLYKGHDGYAGEFGHTILFPDGKPCPCGNQGCFELYASERAILQEYALRMGKVSVTADEFLEDYMQKVPQAREMMDLFIKYMSIGINNVINTFNTDLIVLHSFFSNSIPDINPRIIARLKRGQNRDCRIIRSRLQDLSGLMGGIRLCSQAFLDIEHLKFR